MPNSDLDENRYAAVRDAIATALGVNLSDNEVQKLLAGESLSFEHLVQSHSLSEMGMALIRADALSQQFQAKENANCGEGCIEFCNPVTGRCTCICVNRPILEFRLHPDWLK